MKTSELMTDIQNLSAPAREHIEKGAGTAGEAELETMLKLLNESPSTVVGS